MGDELLNGRLAEDWELTAVRHGRECERARELELLAGLLPEEPVPHREGRPVTDLILELGR